LSFRRKPEFRRFDPSNLLDFCLCRNVDINNCRQHTAFSKRGRASFMAIAILFQQCSGNVTKPVRRTGEIGAAQ
jgi:hypothetical protein